MICQKFKAILLSSILLVSCSPMDMVKNAIVPSKGISVDTEVTAGDKQIKTSVAAKSKVESTTITADSVVYNTPTTNYGPSIWDRILQLLIAFLIGVSMPSWRQMWLMIKNWTNKKGA